MSTDPILNAKLKKPIDLGVYKKKPERKITDLFTKQQIIPITVTTPITSIDVAVPSIMVNEESTTTTTTSTEEGDQDDKPPSSVNSSFVIHDINEQKPMIDPTIAEFLKIVPARSPPYTPLELTFMEKKGIKIPQLYKDSAKSYYGMRHNKEQEKQMNKRANLKETIEAITQATSSIALIDNVQQLEDELGVIPSGDRIKELEDVKVLLSIEELKAKKEKELIEAKEKQVALEKEVTCIELMHQPISLINDVHVQWMKQALVKLNYKGKILATEQCRGKDIYLYCNGDSRAVSTPYFSFIPIQESPISGAADDIEKHAQIFTKKVRSMDPHVDQCIFHFIVYGSIIDPGSPYTNVTPGVTLVDVYWRYPTEEIIKAKTIPDPTPGNEGKEIPDPKQPKDIIRIKYENYTMDYCMLSTWLEAEGQFHDSKGKPLKHLCFRAPTILVISSKLDKVLEFKPDELVSEFDKTVKATGVIYKTQLDCFSLSKKTGKRRRVIGKCICIDKMPFKDPITKTEKVIEYANFNLNDFLSRLKGGPRISLTPSAQLELDKQLKEEADAKALLDKENEEQVQDTPINEEKETITISSSTSLELQTSNQVESILTCTELGPLPNCPEPPPSLLPSVITEAPVPTSCCHGTC